MKVLKEIDPMPAAKMAAVLGAIWGFLVALASLFMGTAFNQYMGRFYTGYQAWSPVGGIIDIVALPVFYAIVGFVITYVVAWLYNLVAKQIGGVKIDLR